MRTLLLATALLFVLPCASSTAQAPPPDRHQTKGIPMHSTGTFDVSVKPAEPSDIAKAADTGRMTIDKSWTGGMTGTSKGEMLTGITKENASMAYVAMERFTGTVDGHAGTLLFSHTAVMRNGKPKPEDLHITIVPGSGTGGLQDIQGTLGIAIEGGVHHYDLTYTLEKQ